MGNSKEYYKANAEKFKGYRENWYKKNPSYFMYHNAKRRAKDMSIPFNLDWRLIEIPEFCPVLGIPMYRGDNGGSENSPSLDRIIPELGYVKGNVKVISSRANRLKSDGSLEDFQEIVKYLVEHRNTSM